MHIQETYEKTLIQIAWRAGCIWQIDIPSGHGTKVQINARNNF